MLLVHSLFSVLLFLAIGAEAAPARKAERGTRTVTGRAVTTTARTSGDLQTYNLGIGGVYAPPVTANNGLFYVNGVPSLTLYDAEVASCTAQLNACTASFSISIGDKLTCQNKQVFDCIAAGQTASTAYTSSAAAASASSSSSSAAAARSSSLAASVAAYSASVGAAASASAHSASVAAAASLSASASAYSASVAAAANVAASASAFSASAAAYSASVALAANAPKSTSSAAPISSVAASSTSSVAGTPTTAPVVTVAGNLQTFSGAIGGVAPAVTANADGSFTMSGTNYPILLNALTQSCYSQAATCLNHASITDQPACWGSQVNACLAAANTIASNYASAGVAYSASVASANLAKATSVRTVAGDLQSFTGSLGGIPAPAVTGSPQNWWMNGLYFYNLIDALDQSCWVQQGLCEAAAVKAGNTFELTINNCDNVQTPACLSNAKNIVANYGHSSSAAPASSTSSVAAAPTNNAASASAYSASSAAAASASAASASSAAAASASAAAAASASAAQASSAAAYSASVAQSASAYSASSAAAASSASAYSASSAAAYSASVAASASAYSASSAAAASASAYSASSAAAYSASVAASAAAYSSSVSAAQAQSTSVPSGWAYASPACIAEGTSGRALTGASTSGPDMTWQKCTSYCSSNGFLLAGLEYSSECYCGNVLTNGASLNRGSSQCNMQASGNNAQVAGGPGALTLFVSNNLDYSKYLPDLTGMIATIPSGWQQATSGGQGICMVEGSSGRALVAASTASDDMTIGKCIDFCASKGAQYAGLEYSRECYCGNDIVNGASLQNTAPCDMQCAGAPGTICGGPNLLSVYTNTNLVYTNTQVGAYSKQGCIQEVAGRALTGASIATNDMTLEKCTNFCQQGGFDFAGLEYAGECYCGNGMSNGASFNAWSTECKMPCSGNSNEICGGPNAISLYSTAKGAQLIGA